MTDLDGYDPDDPKSAGWADRVTTRADERRKEFPDVALDSDGAALGIDWKAQIT